MYETILSKTQWCSPRDRVLGLETTRDRFLPVLVLVLVLTLPVSVSVLVSALPVLTTRLAKPDRQWRSSSFQESKKVRVSRDLDLEHSLDARLPGDHRVQVWWREEAICAKVYRRRTPRHCISSFLEWAKNVKSLFVFWKKNSSRPNNVGPKISIHNFNMMYVYMSNCFTAKSWFWFVNLFWLLLRFWTVTSKNVKPLLDLRKHILELWQRVEGWVDLGGWLHMVRRWFTC